MTDAEFEAPGPSEPSVEYRLRRTARILAGRILGPGDPKTDDAADMIFQSLMCCAEDAKDRGRNEIIDRCAKRFPNSTFWRDWRKP